MLFVRRRVGPLIVWLSLAFGEKKWVFHGNSLWSSPGAWFSKRNNVCFITRERSFLLHNFQRALIKLHLRIGQLFFFLSISEANVNAAMPSETDSLAQVAGRQEQESSLNSLLIQTTKTTFYNNFAKVSLCYQFLNCCENKSLRNTKFLAHVYQNTFKDNFVGFSSCVRCLTHL